ncbi:MAG: UbiD family decarboxylase [Deltaproteobacteria bacterium]|nr:UbiD family decarboxylase [Deltaproteobacteria bacterium]
MPQDYYSDFRAYLGELEKRGRLHRWRRPVNKDTELMPLMRLQYRGIEDGKRRAFLYENVRDGKGKQFDIRVATGVYGSSRDVTALGLGCDDPRDIYEKWRDALSHMHEPRVVSSAPVQEEVYSGARLKEFPVTRLPSPVEEPGFSCGIRVTAPFITKDADTGMRNVGMYSGHFRADHKLIAGIARTHHALLYHHLEVPADAEIVIEGEISIDAMERSEPFSDYPGYLMAERGLRPVIDIKAITHRRDAIFTAILVGLPPSESNGISRTCRELMLYNFLKYSCNIPEVLEICCPEMGGGWNWWVIRMAKSHPTKPKQALQAASGMDTTNKIIITVDEDIDPKDPEMVMWAMSFAMQPHRDAQIVTGKSPLLDPSAYALMNNPEERFFPPPVGCSGLLIDATRKGKYPPVGLPKKQFMERALEIWREEEMPELKLRNPWYGYPLDLWTAQDDELAEAVARGDYFHSVEK